MKYIFDHGYHIHSFLSRCSNDPEQTTQRMIRYAKENGLHTLCLADHFWDETVPGASAWYQLQGYSLIQKAKPLPQDETVKFLFGCETDLDRHLTLGVAPEHFEWFDFLVIPTTHLHMKGFTITEEDFSSIERRKECWINRLAGLLDMPLPFHKIGIAHLTCPLVVPKNHEGYLQLLESLPEEELLRLFAKAAELGVGIELNCTDMSFHDNEADIILRPYRIAKHCGCKFYCGSDAHHPDKFDRAKDVFERAIRLLGLQETDKFHIIK